MVLSYEGIGRVILSLFGDCRCHVVVLLCKESNGHGNFFCSGSCMMWSTFSYHIFEYPSCYIVGLVAGISLPS